MLSISCVVGRSHYRAVRVFDDDDIRAIGLALPLAAESSTLDNKDRANVGSLRVRIERIDHLFLFVSEHRDRIGGRRNSQLQKLFQYFEMEKKQTISFGISLFV